VVYREDQKRAKTGERNGSKEGRKRVLKPYRQEKSVSVSVSAHNKRLQKLPAYTQERKKERKEKSCLAYKKLLI